MVDYGCVDHVNDPYKLYFVGPKWQIELMKEIYGNSIDYYEQIAL